MNTKIEPNQQLKVPRSVLEVMDEELLKEGWTMEELNAERQAGDLIVDFLASGKSVDTIDLLMPKQVETEQATKIPVLQTQLSS